MLMLVKRAAAATTTTTDVQRINVLRLLEAQERQPQKRKRIFETVQNQYVNMNHVFHVPGRHRLACSLFRVV